MPLLYHPTLDDITLEGVLYALSDPLRANIYTYILRAKSPQICAAFLTVNGVPIAKSTLSKHFKILRENGLIRSERKGVELHNVARSKELKKKFGSLIGDIVELYRAQNKALKKKKRKK